MHFSQPSLGNDFTLLNVQIRDSKGWTDGLFAHSLTVPQYNFRFGIFFNEKWGVEVAHRSHQVDRASKIRPSA